MPITADQLERMFHAAASQGRIHLILVDEDTFYGLLSVANKDNRITPGPTPVGSSARFTFMGSPLVRSQDVDTVTIFHDSAYGQQRPEPKPASEAVHGALP